MYTEACEATNKRGEQSAEVLDLRMSCLQERLSGVKALSAIFANADGKVVGNAVSASGALPPLERCGDVKLLRSMVQPPEDPKLRERVAQLRQRVAQIKATRDAGRLKDATQMATALVNDARTIDYPPVQAEAQGMLGELETVAGDPKRAEALLEQAFWTAEAARDDELKAETAVYLIGLLGYRQGRYADAELWAQQSQATLRRIGGHERLQAWMQNNVAIVYHMQGRYPEALAAYQRAREVAERALPPDDPDVARPLGNLAVALMDAGRPAEALPYNQRAVDIFRKTFGAGHPEVATHLTNRGEILNALGRWREARALFTASLAVLTKELPPGDPSFGEALSGIGQSFLGESEPDKAIAPLERAVAIRDKSESEPSHVAATIFMLARALWDSGRDRPRAVTLAKSARTVYGERPLWHDNVVEIDRWVAAHRVAAVVASAPHAR
jgi:tetratricopeptide (TPR) repeat protein